MCYSARYAAGAPGFGAGDFIKGNIASMPSKTYNGLSSRLRGLARQDPAVIPSFFRYEFRRRWGGAQDRRLTAGGGAVLPALISLNPTRRCNLRCRMCFQYRRESEIPDTLAWYHADQELPLSAWVNLLDEVAAWRLRQSGPHGPPLPPWSRLLDRLATWRPVVYVTGGEPLLYPQVVELLAAARSRRLLVHLQTNGTLLAGAAPDLASLGLQMVSVSLDGPPEVHDRIRGVPGSFRVRRRARGRIPVGFSPDLPDSLLSPYYLDLAHPFPQECRHLWMACRILPDGSVSPCLHLVMGRITEAPLSRIWNNDHCRSLRRLAAQRLFPGCTRCCYRRFQ
ncbi:MAG: radical SAM protein [Deltaproteobacteria bacterium]|nr:radical SAM protein [Deltaproteobacteria bacterium]